MPRKRSASKKSNTEENSQPSGCPDNVEATPGDTDSKLGNWATSPFKLASSAYRSLTGEFNKLLDEKAAAAEEPIKFVPSVVSFVLCLLLVKNYAESMDALFTGCLAYGANSLHKLYATLAGLTCDELEGIAAFVVVVLCWIGAFKIIANIVRRIVEMRRASVCKCND